MKGDKQSRVIYTGIRAGSEREAAEVLELVGAKLGLNRQRTLALLRERPAVVAERLQERQAARVAQQLAALGLLVVVWPQVPAPAEPEAEFLALPGEDLLELEIPLKAGAAAPLAEDDEWLDEIPGGELLHPEAELETVSGKDKLDSIMRELLKTEAAAAPAQEAAPTVSTEDASRFWPLLAQMRDRVSGKDRAGILKQILRMGDAGRQVAIQEAELTAEPTVLLLDDPVLRPVAMDMLARMGETGAAALSRELVRRSQKHEGLEAYIELAGQAGGPGIEALSRALRDETERVQELVKTAERLEYENQREAAKQHDAGQGASKTKAMLDRERQIGELQEEMEEVHRNRFNLVKALGHVRSEAVVGPLIGVLQDPQDKIKVLATKALIALGRLAIPHLVQELKPSYISTAEADILVEIGPEAAPFLVESMKHTTWTLEQDALFRIGKPAVEPLLAGLDDPDPAVRLKAISVLGRIADARAVLRLIELLQAPDTPLEHRPRVLWALGRIGDARAVEPIIDAMQRPELRTDAIKALHRVGTPTVEAIRKLGPRVLAPFIDALDDYALRPIAEEFLGQLGELAYEPIAAALDREELRIPAIEILGRLGDRRAAERLLQLAGDENLDVRRAAMGALGALQIKEALEPLLAGLHDPEVAPAAAAALGHLRDPRAVPDLVLCLTDHQEELPKKAAEALGNIGSPEAVEPLLKAVGVEHTRWAALVAVAKLGEPAREAMRQKGAPMIEALISHLKRAKTLGHLGRINGPEVRGAIIDFLVSFGPMSLEYLLKEFKKDEGIAEAIGRIRSPDTYQFLMTALLSDDPELHKQAAIALGWFGQRSVIPALVRLLETESREIESLKIFAESVMRLDSGTAIPELVKLLASSHKKETVEVIEKILTAQPEVVLSHLLETLKEERAEVYYQTELHILELFGSRAVEPLLQALRDTALPDNRRRLIQALGRVGGDRAVGALIAQLQDPEESVAVEAVRALEKLCVRQALQPFYELRERLGRTEPALDRAIVTIQQWGT